MCTRLLIRQLGKYKHIGKVSILILTGKEYVVMAGTLLQ